MRDAVDERAKTGGLHSQKEVSGLFAPPHRRLRAPPGERALGAWWRMDMVLCLRSGLRWLLDIITTPCALTKPRVRAFAAGGAADAHVREAPTIRRILRVPPWCLL